MSAAQSRARLLAPSETALDLRRRSLAPVAMATGLGFIPELRPSNVVQLSGPSGSGKSEVMLHLAARCLMPGSLGGQGGDVVYFDIAHQLDILRLAHIIRCATSLRRGDVSEAELDDSVESCMSRLAVYTCESSLQFYAALSALRSRRAEQRSSPSASVSSAAAAAAGVSTSGREALDRLLGVTRGSVGEAPAHRSKKQRRISPSPADTASLTPSSARRPSPVMLGDEGGGGAAWGSHGKVRLLLIDHMGAFHWQDVMRRKQRGLTSIAEIARADGSIAKEQIGVAPDALTKRLQRLQRDAAAALKRTMRSAGLAAVLACPSLFGARQGYLPDSWARLVTHDVELKAVGWAPALSGGSSATGGARSEAKCKARCAATSFAAAVRGAKRQGTQRTEFTVDDDGVCGGFDPGAVPSQ